MRPDIKARWVAALRSGEYQQGRANLYTEDSNGKHFCCLGVLCDLAVQDGLVSWDDQANVRNTTVHGINGEFEQLPVEVTKWAGIDNTSWPEHQPKVLLPGHPFPLPIYNVNDGVGNGVEDPALACPAHTFAQLADLIEQQL